MVTTGARAAKLARHAHGPPVAGASPTRRPRRRNTRAGVPSRSHTARADPVKGAMMEKVTTRVGLRTPYLLRRRLDVARPFLSGRVLDVGCNVGSLTPLVP